MMIAENLGKSASQSLGKDYDYTGLQLLLATVIGPEGMPYPICAIHRSARSQTFSLLRPDQRSQGVTEKVHKEEPTRSAC